MVLDPDQAQARALVRQILARTGMKPTHLAREAKVAPSTINRFLNSEKVKHTLSARTVRKVVKAAEEFESSAGRTMPAHDIGRAPKDNGMDIPADPVNHNSSIIRIPELDVSPHAGPGAENPDLDGSGQHPVLAEWRIPAEYLLAYVGSKTGLRILRVAGDSMEPEYPAGERVLVDTQHRTPSPPGVYVLWDGFGLVMKRLEVIQGSNPRMVRLSSINPAYPPAELPVGDVQINGRVIGRWVWR